MKKMRKLTALVVSLLLLVLSQANVLGISFKEVTENIPSLETVSLSNAAASAGQIVLENDKYIFVAQGVAPQFVRNGAVRIYSKQTGELLKTITQISSSSAWHCPVKDMVLAGDVLIVSWGHSLSISDGAFATTSGALRADVVEDAGSSLNQSPVFAYDVSNVTADSELTRIEIDYGNEYGKAYYPHVWGESLYYDAETEIIYTAKYSRSYGKLYKGFKASDIAATFENAEATVAAAETFNTGVNTLSVNMAQFIVKDGWLFEVLQDNGGLIGITTSDTLVDGNGTQFNNMVYAFNMNGLDLSSRKAVASKLKGVYTTAVTGDSVINDIEVYGDYMYIATTEGIEVVSLEAAYAEDITAETAPALTKVKDIKDADLGGVMDLEIEGTILYAGFSGKEVYAELEAETHSDGALALYDITAPENPTLIKSENVAYGAADILVNDFEKNVYVLCDTKLGPVLKVLSFAGETPTFISNVVLDEAEDAAPALTAAYKTYSGKTVLENEKYIFVAQGDYYANWSRSGAVRIYDKATGELIKSITQLSTSSAWYMPVKNMWLYDDVLYVTWGHVINYSNGAISSAYRTDENIQSPTIAYDVSNVTAETDIAKLQIDAGNAYGTKHYPYVGGGIAYLDEENGLIYTSKVSNATDGRRYYTSFDAKAMKAAIEAGSLEAVTRKSFRTANLSMNTTQFIVKDGWLFEVLQDNAGLTAVTATNSLVDSEGNQMNNTIRIYNLNGVEITSSTAVANYLRGTYTTAVAGDAVIEDIEVSGDYMYVATSAGIEVVDLTPAKAYGLTSATAAVLEKVATVKEENVGNILDIELSGDFLYAGYAGTEVFPSLVEGVAPEQSDGALVVYDLANPELPVKRATETIAIGVSDIEVCEDEGKIYMINDTIGSDEIGSLVIYDFAKMPINLVADGNAASSLTAGTYDISIDMVNPDNVSGQLICALYSGNTLSDVLVAEVAEGGNIVFADDYEIEGNITKIKVMFMRDFIGITPITEAIVLEK